jgi:hypothetical protein
VIEYKSLVRLRFGLVDSRNPIGIRIDFGSAMEPPASNRRNRGSISKPVRAKQPEFLDKHRPFPDNTLAKFGRTFIAMPSRNPGNFSHQSL